MLRAAVCCLGKGSVIKTEGQRVAAGHDARKLEGGCVSTMGLTMLFSTIDRIYL
jgi:hypothetical protein